MIDSLLADKNIYNTFDDHEMDTPLLSHTSLISSLQRDTGKTGLDAVRDFRRSQTIRRQELNNGMEKESILHSHPDLLWNDEMRSTSSIETIHQRWRRMQKSFFIACVSSTLIIFWGFVALVEESILVFLTASAGSITSLLSLSFEPKLYMATRYSDEINISIKGSITDEVMYLQERNKSLEEQVELLKEQINCQEDTVHDFHEMKYELTKRKLAYDEENEKLLKEIKLCKALDKVLDEIFIFLVRKANQTNLEEKEQRVEELNKSLLYSNLVRQLESNSSGFDWNEVRTILQPKNHLEQTLSDPYYGEREVLRIPLDANCEKSTSTSAPGIFPH